MMHCSTLFVLRCSDTHSLQGEVPELPYLVHRNDSREERSKSTKVDDASRQVRNRNPWHQFSPMIRQCAHCRQDQPALPVEPGADPKDDAIGGIFTVGCEHGALNWVVCMEPNENASQVRSGLNATTYASHTGEIRFESHDEGDAPGSR
jgi:hypothetical protein